MFFEPPWGLEGLTIAEQNYSKNIQIIIILIIGIYLKGSHLFLIWYAITKVTDMWCWNCAVVRALFTMPDVKFTGSGVSDKVVKHVVVCVAIKNITNKRSPQMWEIHLLHTTFISLYLLVEGFSVTVRWTGICKSPFTHKYQPLLSVLRLLIVTVKTLWARESMVTVVLAKFPDDPITQDVPSLHHFTSPELL